MMLPGKLFGHLQNNCKCLRFLSILPTNMPPETLYWCITTMVYSKKQTHLPSEMFPSPQPCKESVQQSPKTVFYYGCVSLSTAVVIDTGPPWRRRRCGDIERNGFLITDLSPPHLPQLERRVLMRELVNHETGRAEMKRGPTMSPNQIRLRKASWNKRLCFSSYKVINNYI